MNSNEEVCMMLNRTSFLIEVIPKQAINHQMAGKKFDSDVAEMDNMDVANEVVTETYSQQQQGPQGNSVDINEVSAVLPLVDEGYAIPDEVSTDQPLFDKDRATLNVRDCTEQDNSIVVLDPVINEEIISRNGNKEITSEQEDELDPVSTESNTLLAVCHEVEVMNSEKPEPVEGIKITKRSDGDDDNVIHSDSKSSTCEESCPEHRILTRSATKAAKSTTDSAEVGKTPNKRKRSAASSTSSDNATPTRSVRTSSLAKNIAKKSRRSRTAHK
uniref:Shugoshin_C domain-containing protein n=1 Tax=Elaeophora elaphi TaxID=1147741 RepID=A0A158Q7Q9_9BILA